MSLGAAAIAAAAATCPSGLAGGSLQLLDASGAVLRSATLDGPSAGNADGAVFVAGGMPKAMAGIGAGVVAAAKLCTAGGAEWSAGATVGLPGSGAQVIVSVSEGPNAGTLTLGATDAVSVLSATLTYGAG